MSYQHFYLLASILIGLLIGSFLNVCILRIPSRETLGGRSMCPGCKAKIAWYDNIPLFSYLLLKGRCRNCEKRISPQYPIVEALTALLAALTMIRVDYLQILFGVWFFLFVCPLIVISFIDMRHRIIPDVISLPGILLGIGATLLLSWPNWQSALKFSFLGILAGGGTLYILGVLYYLIRKRDGMGGGDIKLAAMLGAFLGWQAVVFVFLLSSILALIYALIAQILATNKEEGPMVIPYGPFLATAALIFFLYGYEIKAFYFSLIGIPS